MWSSRWIKGKRCWQLFPCHALNRVSVIYDTQFQMKNVLMNWSFEFTKSHPPLNSNKKISSDEEVQCESGESIRDSFLELKTFWLLSDLLCLLQLPQMTKISLWFQLRDQKWRHFVHWFLLYLHRSIISRSSRSTYPSILSGVFSYSVFNLWSFIYYETRGCFCVLWWGRMTQVGQGLL